MSYEQQKKAAALVALDYIQIGDMIGVGTGSTVAYFITALATIKNKIDGIVSSSEQTTQKLQALGFRVRDTNSVDKVDVYVDGADEINPQMQMIKGGGGALTREKIIAAMAKKYVCIVDQSKIVKILGGFPLPVEVIPMARSYVARELIKLGGLPEYRQNVVTDNGNIILDIHNLEIMKPIELEQKINNIPGVVTVGLFAQRGADILLIGKQDKVEIIKA